jgi:TldD protein
MDTTVVIKSFSSLFKYLEFREHKIERTQLMVINGEPVSPVLSKSEGYSVRAFDGNSIFFTSSHNISDLNPTSLKVKRGWEKGVDDSKRESGSYEVEEKIKLSDVPIDAKIKELVELSKHIYSLNLKSKILSVNLYYSESVENKRIVFETGEEVKGRIPRVRLFYSITMKYGDRSVTISQDELGNSGGYEVFKNWNLISFFEEKLKSVDEVLVKGKGVSPGRRDVVLSSMLTGIIAHESVGHPFEADRVLGRESAQAGLSYLVGRNIGEKIGSEAVTVIDDPTIYGTLGYYTIDDEGVRARAKYLIKEGVINELLQDRFSAYKFGVMSNASARASAFDRVPLVRMSNTFFKPGNYSFEELVEDIKDGVYFKSYMEWNIDDLRVGERYVGLEAYEIKNGEIGEPLLFPVLETTTFELLSKVDAVDNTLKLYPGTCGKGDPDQPLPVSLGGPNMRARDISIKVRE